MFSLRQYDSFRIFLLVSTSIPYLAFSIPRFIAPTRKGPEKLTSYESGIEPKGDAWIQFEIRYYMFASVFTVSDVETVSLYPWAIAFRELGLFAFIEVIIFTFIPIIGLVHAWRKGASEWSQLPDSRVKVAEG
uniref:NADH-plastoquinone oxidoreductase subunit 3 n=1 Tax=Microlepia speluncae TaxID=449865 RepID=UPI001FA78B11|nr:NADH-plastoquinone oxidoreductase subunit 3 [Microlepia speluncae]ULU28016.1 NADH-plastoquinone oxidoreductase subunit 3 [Microlepia speluncae]